MSTVEHVGGPADPPTPTPEQFLEIDASPEFADLKRTLRSWVFPMTAFFLLWYAVYVLLGAFAHDFMAIKVWGNINVGIFLGVAQIITTFLITGLYVRFANSKLDPKAQAIRDSATVAAAANVSHGNGARA
ncbi:DUF485 domain-containing protein [Gordonia sp. TBRC 11910]|uniref:DUF485 domain-containing protein n=1 Tax=Gordonia asplenii TaxID=2725283 RepID=A0A848KV29_9ACTN|nr:DUF485 domain-containing protein [Gordonia asplenii]NMO00715.1 DUF485 domain-containing protein [Gordonia asplenii]